MMYGYTVLFLLLIFIYWVIRTIDVTAFFTSFIIFIKNGFLMFFLFLEGFLFSSGEICYPTKPAKILLNLLKFSIKRLLNDGFNMAAIKIISLRAVALGGY